MLGGSRSTTAALGAGPSSSRVVAAFDFDGTMTTHDTFRLFLREAFGWQRVARECSRLLPAFASFSISNRDQLKERLLFALLQHQPVAPWHAFAQRFQPKLRALLRLGVIDQLRWHQACGHRCVMVSASLDLYLAPIAKEFGFDNLLCTRLQTDPRREPVDGFPAVPRHEDRFTGHLVGVNCRRQEKVNRLTALLGDLSQYEMYAYGDSVGDKEMLAVAQHPFFRHYPSGALE